MDTHDESILLSQPYKEIKITGIFFLKILVLLREIKNNYLNIIVRLKPAMGNNILIYYF